MNKISSLDELHEHYGEPPEGSLRKVTPSLTPAYRQLLEASPFCLVATSGPEGLDCSPRGDSPGFVSVLSEKTLALPDRRGNNRLDTLRNIVRNGQIAMLFLIPGVSETLRINGNAWLTDDKALRARLAHEGKMPATIIIVDIAEVYFQCARAVTRSGLWDVDAQVDRQSLPSAGQLTRSAWDSFDAETYDAALAERQAKTLY